jgi:hypothetical protein
VIKVVGSLRNVKEMEFVAEFLECKSIFWIWSASLDMFEMKRLVRVEENGQIWIGREKNSRIKKYCDDGSNLNFR